jgi:hypothetical protein
MCGGDDEHGRHLRHRPHVPASLFFEDFLYLADLFLNFTFVLFIFAFGFQVVTVRQHPRQFLGGALHFVKFAFYLILCTCVHDSPLCHLCEFKIAALALSIRAKWPPALWLQGLRWLFSLPSHHLDTRESAVEFLAPNFDLIDYLLYVTYLGCHLLGSLALFCNVDTAFERENAVLDFKANVLFMQAI